MSDQFIFWDLETTGRNDKYDQITQVGAVLTDNNFEVKDKLEIHSKLREGKWFEPGALITTGVDPINLFKNNYPNYYEASAQLYETFQQWSSPSAIFIGFNNIRHGDSTVFFIGIMLLPVVFYCAYKGFKLVLDAIFNE